jgi:hypothetical protein
MELGQVMPAGDDFDHGEGARGSLPISSPAEVTER